MLVHNDGLPQSVKFEAPRYNSFRDMLISSSQDLQSFYAPKGTLGGI